MEILVLRLSSLGDIVLSSAFTQSAVALWPEARITYVVRADFAAVAAALPGVARVVPIERELGVAGLVRAASDLRRTRWAHVFDLHQSLRSRLLCTLVRRRAVPGFDKQEWARFVLLRLRHDVYARSGGTRPLRERMLEPLRRLGLDPPRHTTRLVLPASAREAARAALHSAGAADSGWIGIAPGARWGTKRWGDARFAALAARLAATSGRRLLIVGGAGERALCGLVAMAAPGRAFSVAGELDLLGTAAALAQCELVVTNDSGLAHVAEAVGRPVIALFGPTSPQFGYAPYRSDSRLLRRPPPCSPCSKNGARPCSRPTHECMENMSPDWVAAEVDSALAAAPAIGSS